MAPVRFHFNVFRPREFHLSGAIYFLLLLNLPSSSLCQWYKLAEFISHPGVIFFLPDSISSKIGFVGTGHTGVPLYSELWRTSDAGITWSRAMPGQFPLAITGITFKDSLVGWLSCGFNSNPAGSGCYKTTDGGSTWNYLSATYGTSVSIHYANKILYLIQWNKESILSRDEGLTWEAFTIASCGFTGLAHNGLNNFILAGGGEPTCQTMIISTDGGSTWQNTDFPEECWQTFGLERSNTFFAASEVSGNIYRSDDGGLNWNYLTKRTNTGHVAGNSRDIYFQSYDGGIIKLVDGGNSWKSICGPYNQYADTRFYVGSTNIYAGDFFRTEPSYSEFGRLWVNTTGAGSGDRLVIQHTSSLNDITVSPGELWTANLVLPKTFSTLQEVKLDSLSFTIRYQRDLFSIGGVAAATGWRVDNYSEEYDRVRVKLLRESGEDRGVPVATVTFITNIADSISSDVYIDSVFYNAGELTNCEIIPSEKLHVTVVDNCGDSLLREFIGREKFELVSLHPNPAKDKLTVEVKMPVRGTISVNLVDLNARTIIQPNQTLEQGVQSFTLDLTNLSYTGAYQIILTFFDDVATGSFVLTK